jgi:EAL domain-containing protein (putative c-di-GMP-specific phosphodiesterase class I)
MRTAFAEAKAWDERLTLAVNISPKQLSDARLAETILAQLDEAGFPAERLEIEITESSLFEDLEIAREIVAALKGRGIRLVLDDFGTGYSSLAHLRSLPFDRIKIDRSFVLALSKDPESWAMVQTIAGLGRTLGVPVTVEGVESAVIELRVRTLGCELGQGWFYGEAASAAHTRQLLEESASEAPWDTAAGAVVPLTAAEQPPRRVA